MQKELVCCLQGHGHMTDILKMWLFLLCHLNLLLPNFVWWYIITSLVINLLCKSQQRLKTSLNIMYDLNFLLKSFLQKNCYATIKVKVTVRSHMAQIYHFYYILRAADLFETKNSLMIHHHKLAKRFDSCVQSQGHSDGWILHWMFVSSVFSVPLIPSQQN